MTLEWRCVIAVLACFRLAELVAVDHGPADLCDRFRTACAQRSAGLSKLVGCPWCVGLWFALPLAVWVTGLSADIVTMGIVALAIAGGQAFLENVGGRS